MSFFPHELAEPDVFLDDGLECLGPEGAFDPFARSLVLDPRVWIKGTPNGSKPIRPDLLSSL